jgi:hypothetical protein
MARIRTIKPEFPQSESIGALSRDARLLFILLWTLVDDEGRARAASRMLASLLYPYDDDAPDLIDGWLGELEDAGIIRRYKVDGSIYLDIPHWAKHQKIDHKSVSRLPAFEEASEILANPREPSRALAPDLGPRTSTSTNNMSAHADVPAGKVLKVGEPHALELPVTGPPAVREVENDFAEWYAAYPRREARGKALKAYRAARKKADREILLAAVKQSRPEFSDPNYTPLPASWLNAERWLDEKKQKPKYDETFPEEIYRNVL